MAETRRGEAIWMGDLLSGRGSVSAATTGVFRDLDVTWAARTEAHGGRTSPEELLAAAHAACFSMALSNTLAKAGTPPERLDVSADVTFDKVGDGWKVVSSALRVRGRVPGADEDGFRAAVEKARVGCPISGALAGNVEITAEAELAG
jgi:lipoyl-dependent peroxiredoxin